MKVCIIASNIDEAVTRIKDKMFVETELKMRRSTQIFLLNKYNALRSLTKRMYNVI